ncbi:hypothetical protein HDU93_000227 [Gonapodya sp. JEL0774]|nr:hypothetical protein HDU93_000227 [Gonapodya sp. JEL0774]
MSNWQRLIRFDAVEGGIHYGEPLPGCLGPDGSLDPTRAKISAKEVVGGPFAGAVTDTVLTVKKLLCPLECTPAIPCIGLNYRDHATEAQLPIPKYPVLFIKYANSLAGPTELITLPACTNDDQMDYEAELCVVIGKGGKNIPLEKALDHVLGYTAGNDISARRWQRECHQFCFGKGMDKFAPIGPQLVSPSLMPDPQKLRLRGFVDGAEVQNASTDGMIFSVAEIISFISKGTTLLPGMVIMTGTPGGVGLSKKPPIHIQEGTVCRIEIGGIGFIENTFGFEKIDTYSPPRSSSNAKLDVRNCCY